MRSSELRLVIAFHTTADAMAIDSACRGKKQLGKMIPVPRQISAGCGLAWSADLSARTQLEEILEREGVQPEGIFELKI